MKKTIGVLSIALLALSGCGRSLAPLTKQSWVERDDNTRGSRHYQVTGKTVASVGSEYLVISKNGSASQGPVTWKTNIPWEQVQLYTIPGLSPMKELAIKDNNGTYVEAAMTSVSW